MPSNPGTASFSERFSSTSLSFTSSTDFCPKLRMFISCVSDRDTSSLTVLMPSRFRQL